jgi:hypothetical protein
MRAFAKESRRPRLSLRAQGGDFWIGAFMVAEALLLLGLAFLAPETRESLWTAIVASPLGLAGAGGVAISLGIFTGWLAHRLGFGQ